MPGFSKMWERIPPNTGKNTAVTCCLIVDGDEAAENGEDSIV